MQRTQTVKVRPLSSPGRNGDAATRLWRVRVITAMADRLAHRDASPSSSRNKRHFLSAVVGQAASWDVT